MLKSINLALRFLLELCAVVAVGYWGFRVGSEPVARLVLGIGAPLLVVALWAMFVAPKARVALPRPCRFILGLLVLELAAVALAAAGHPKVAIALGEVVAINAVPLLVWNQSST